MADEIQDKFVADQNQKQPEENMLVVWSPHASRFQTSDGLAYLSYEFRSSGGGRQLGENEKVTLDLQYAFVPPALRGHRIAESLCDFAFGFARERGWRIIPTCSYVAEIYIPQHPESREIVNPGVLKPDWYESGSHVELLSFGLDSLNPLLSKL